MSNKGSNFTLLKYGLKHPVAVYNFILENRRLKMNQKHPFMNSVNIRLFEKHENFLESLFGSQFFESYYIDDLSDKYENLVSKIRNLYGDDKSLSILSLEESISLYLSTRFMKPEVVVETGVSDGISTFFILSALKENQKGNLYSIDFPEVGMPRLYGKEPGWIVNEELRIRWKLIYGKSKIRLPPLLAELKHVDIFLHDSEHSYSNMKFEFSTALKYMGNGSLLLSDDVRSNSAFQEALNEFGIDDSNISLLIGNNSDFGGAVINNGKKVSIGSQLK